MLSRINTHGPDPGHSAERISMAQETQISKVLLIVIAFFIPPLAVGLKAGIGGPLILNIILTLLFWLPGFLHALYLLLK